MDPFTIVWLVGLVISFSLYMADRKGWHSTAKRITTIVRANLEANQPIKELEPVKDLDDWTERFDSIENPRAALVPAKPKKHEIIKHSYYDAGSQGAWPQWVCKCGGKGHVPIGIWNEEETLKRARNQGQTHVESMNDADEKLSKSDGKFAW